MALIIGRIAGFSKDQYPDRQTGEVRTNFAMTVAQQDGSVETISIPKELLVDLEADRVKLTHFGNLVAVNVAYRAFAQNGGGVRETCRALGVVFPELADVPDWLYSESTVDLTTV